MRLSKKNNLKTIPKLIFALGVALLFCSLKIYAQEMEVRIKVVSAAPARIRVEGKLLNAKGNFASRNWSFLQNYADVAELGGRLENLSLFDAAGNGIAIKKLAAGEYQFDAPPVSFVYDVKTEVPLRLTSAAHVSWISGVGGLLMLNDLLPQSRSGQPVSGRVSFEIPDGWRIASSETANSANSFSVKNLEKAIFLIGAGWREKTVRVGKTDLNVVIAGEWQYSDEEAWQMAAAVLEEHGKTFGEIPASKVQVFLLPFVQRSNQTQIWRAETRGATVTILSGIVPRKSQALQRLHEQLRHEILHLWLPNSLALTGSYDWFYEGFTVYAALAMGVRVNQIRFDDFLNTLAQAFDLAQNQPGSLIEISSKRWLGGNGSVYAKGMLAAFLSDAALLGESRGRRSLAEVFRRIYQKHRLPNPAEDGNTAILKILKSYPELGGVVRNYIEGNKPVEWAGELKSLGMESGRNESGTTLKVASRLTSRQKDLLDKLGYNQWRKLLQKGK